MAAEGPALHPRLTTSGAHPPSPTRSHPLHSWASCSRSTSSSHLAAPWTLQPFRCGTGEGGGYAAGPGCMAACGAQVVTTFSGAAADSHPPSPHTVYLHMHPLVRPPQADTPRDLDYNSELVTVGEGARAEDLMQGYIVG